MHARFSRMQGQDITHVRNMHKGTCACKQACAYVCSPTFTQTRYMHTHLHDGTCGCACMQPQATERCLMTHSHMADHPAHSSYLSSPRRRFPGLKWSILLKTGRAAAATSPAILANSPSLVVASCCAHCQELPLIPLLPFPNRVQCAAISSDTRTKIDSTQQRTCSDCRCSVSPSTSKRTLRSRSSRCFLRAALFMLQVEAGAL